MASTSSKADTEKLAETERILFTPAGKAYTDQDGIRIFAQQPIDRIPRYLMPRKNPRFLPPLLHYGWILDEELTFKLALELSEPFYHYIYGSKKPDYWTTFTGLISRLMAHLGLPVDRRVSVCQIGTVELSPKARIVRRLGLSMGTNYTGHIPEESAKKMRDATAPGADLKWYLDTKRCKWVENHRWRDPAKEKHSEPHTTSDPRAVPAQT